jgi:hypothetical protein
MTGAIIAALLYLYPPRWRHEYGDELQDLLRQRPLRVGSVVDVAWRGVCQRWHEGGPVLAIGLFMVPWVAGLVANNIFGPHGYVVACTHGMLHDSRISFPSVLAEPGGAEFFAFVLTACGLIVRLRERVPRWRSGVAATQLAAVAGAPVLILGLLLIAGIVDLRVITPAGGAATTAHGWTYTYCTSEGRIPAPLAVFAAPLLRLPQAFLYGLFGGWIASWLRVRA